MEDYEDSEDEFCYKDNPYHYSRPESVVTFQEQQDSYILIDSGDRNLQQEGLFKFKINFSITSNSYDKSMTLRAQEREQITSEIQQLQQEIARLATLNVTLFEKDIYALQLRREKLLLQQQQAQGNSRELLYTGQDDFCHTQKRYNDIQRISCEQIWMPQYDFLNTVTTSSNQTIDINGQHMVYLSIRELQCPLDGSNNSISTSYQSMIPRDQPKLNHLVFEPLNHPPVNPIPMNLSYMTIQLHFPSAYQTIPQPDKYEISAFTVTASPVIASGCTVTCYLKSLIPTTYLRVGHLCQLYGITFKNPLLMEFQSQLNSPHKHVIVEKITTPQAQISAFQIELTGCTQLSQWIELFHTPQLVKEVYAINLSHQYQLLFRVTKTVSTLGTERFPGTTNPTSLSTKG